MGVKHFELSITNKPAPVFMAGEWIQGHVKLAFDEPTKARGVTLRFHGFAHVHWTERHSTGSGKSRRTVTRHYSNQETYFDSRIFLWGDGSGGGLFETSPMHPAGEHVYPFQFQLPANLPSSYEANIGRVRYYIECAVDRPWKFDHKAKLPFTVNSIYDLNQVPSTREPVSGKQIKTLCCWCCESGPITNALTLDRGGYVPGEFIVVNGEVDNKSNRKMTSSSLMLRKYTTFTATTKRRTTVENIVHLRRGNVDPGDSEVWSGERIHIPPLPPSDLIHCNIIHIKYYVVLIADPSGPSFDLEAPCEVTIGTVPLQNIQHIYARGALAPPPPPPAFNPQLQQQGGGDPAYPPEDVLYSAPAAPEAAGSTTDAPQPTFAQYNMQVDIRDQGDQYTHGNTTFAPQYTYYTWDK